MSRKDARRILPRLLSAERSAGPKRGKRPNWPNFGQHFSGLGQINQTLTNLGRNRRAAPENHSKNAPGIVFGHLVQVPNSCPGARPAETNLASTIAVVVRNAAMQRLSILIGNLGTCRDHAHWSSVVKCWPKLAICPGNAQRRSDIAGIGGDLGSCSMCPAIAEQLLCICWTSELAEQVSGTRGEQPLGNFRERP